MQRIRVGILGATGAVGQQFIRLLDGHPWFEVTAVAASERSAGRPYGDVVRWIAEDRIPDRVASLLVQDARPPLDCEVVFSGLDARIAGEVEEEFAAAGMVVVSNARNHRMRADVPLLIPDVNPDHLELVFRQKGPGLLVTNPNCATVGLTCALKPIVDAFGVRAVQVTTMQAISGAGYPGVPSLDILGNVIPFIGGEEEKLETEPLKILGRLEVGTIRPLEAAISAQCNRVPVLDGHLISASVRLDRAASATDVADALAAYRSPLDGLGLPSAPARPVELATDDLSPQPRRHARRGAGMTVTVGRVRPCPVLDVRFVALVHNTIRGAAGGAILNAELMAHRGLIANRTGIRPSVEDPSKPPGGLDMGLHEGV